MTTFTVSTGQEAIAAGVAGAALFAFGLFIGLGWLRFTFSIGAVPPWNRKPAAKKNPDSAVPAAGETPAGTAGPTAVRKVS